MRDIFERGGVAMTPDKDDREKQPETQREKDKRDDWGEGLTPEMEEALEEFFEEYDEALRKLKDR